MKQNGKMLVALALFVATVLVSSCQRGYGCPYKFDAKAQTQIAK